MGIIKSIKTVDKKARVTLPREWANEGDKVYFAITKAGHLIVRKVNENETQSLKGEDL